MTRDEERAAESAEEHEVDATGASPQQPESGPGAAAEGTPGAVAGASGAAPAATPSPPTTVAASDQQHGAPAAIAWLALVLALVAAAVAVWALLESQRELASLQQRLIGMEAVSGRDSGTLEQLGAALERQVELEVKAAETSLRGERQEADDQLRDRLAEIAASVRSARERQDSDSAALGALREGLRERIGRLDERLARQSARFEEFQQLSSGDREGWLLTEANYLLRLANQRLVMSGDTASAKALLQSADDVLRELDDPSLRPVRQAIADDLAAVRAVPAIDREGTWLRLAALIERSEQLEVFELPALETAAVDAIGEGDWQARLRAGYERALEKLAGYVTIRRRDQPVEVLMDPQWERLVRQNLRMLLEQAQVALLSANARLYEESLASATGWVEEFRASDAEEAGAVIDELASLRDTRVRVELPDASDSLAALRAQLRARSNSSRGGA